MKFGRWVLLILKYAAILGFAGLTLVYVAFEAQNIRWAMLKMRLESNCRDPKVDIEACGQFAIQNLYHPSTEDEHRAGLKLLTTMCEQGNPEACRNIAFSGESWMVDTVTYRDWQATAWQSCEQDGGESCMALAYHATDAYPKKFYTVMAARCRKHDLAACAAWVHVAGQRNSEIRKEVLETACQSGLIGACASATVPLPLKKTACEEHDNPYVCFLAETSPDLKTWCANGVVQACRPDAWETFDGDRTKTYWDTRTLITTVPTNCADGVVEDCLQDGLRHLAETQRAWRPEPLDPELFGQTFKKACEDGHNRACVEGAVALLDHEIGPPSNTTLAYELFSKACDRRDVQACWFLLSAPELSENKRKELIDHVCWNAPRGYAEYVGACAMIGSNWLATNKLTPWRMDWVSNHAVMLDTCTKHRERGACARLAENLYSSTGDAWPTLPPKHVMAWSSAAIGCAKHRADACRTLVDVSKTWPTPTQQSVDELGTSVCAKVPKMCEAFTERLQDWNP